MWWKKYNATGWGEELCNPTGGLQVTGENASLEIVDPRLLGRPTESKRQQF
jgi:hypothetical protein